MKGELKNAIRAVKRLRKIHRIEYNRLRKKNISPNSKYT